MKRIYILTEETRWGTETWDLGAPDGIEVVYEHFYFDTKYGELNEQDIAYQVHRLKELQAETGTDLSYMISQREEWLQDRRDAVTEEIAANARRAEAKREEARKILREAGELP